MPEFIQPMTQTRIRGTHAAEYEIYVTAAESLGWTVKTYDEWFGS